MVKISPGVRVVTSVLANLLAAGALATAAVAPQAAVAAGNGVRHAGRPAGGPVRIRPSTRPHLDFSGRNRTGIASFYADWFAGRKMADGARMNPRTNNAASRTLPLGTIARVTNLKTHKSAVVTIQDRGPYVQGRIVDLSPATAKKIGITRKIGIARVRVTPIAIPLRNGHIKQARHTHDRSCDGRCDVYRVALQKPPTEIE
jgi:peptidoglycan lytic transglycosylase